MKIKNYLLKLTVGIAAFVFGFGAVSIWQFFQTRAIEIVNKYYVTEKFEPIGNDWGNVRQNYSAIESKLTVDLSGFVNENSTEETNNIEHLKNFDPSGYYYFTGENHPKDFEDFQYFALWIEDLNIEAEVDSVPVLSKGHLLMGVDDETSIPFDYKQLFVSPKGVTFSTEKINGISYRFSGIFLKNGEVIEGKIVKLKNDKQIAEAKLTLEFTVGC